MGRKVIKVNKSTAIVVEPFKNDHGDYVGIREFYKPRDNEESDWLPTRNGFSIPADEEVGTKLRKAIKWAIENFDDEHKVLESKGKGKKKSKDDEDEDDKPKKKKKRRTEDDDE